MKVNQITQESRFDRRDAYQRDYDSSVSGMGRGDDHRGLRQELAHERNNIQIAINGRPWKVVAGRGTADSAEERSNLENMKQWAERKSASSGKTWTVYLTGAEVSESGIPGNVPVEKIPGKQDLLKGRGRTYYEDQTNSAAVDDTVDEGWKDKLAAAGLAGAMALGASGANARVTPDGQGGYTGGLKPTATQPATDTAPAKAEAPKGFSKEYLQKAADPNRFGRYMISIEKAQELLNNMQEGVAEGNKKPAQPEADYGDDYQDMVARVKKLAGMGPLKTVYDPQKRVYKNVPTAVQPPKK